MRAPVLKILLASLAIAPFGGHGSLGADSFQVIVNRSNPATQLSRKFVEDAFLKKIAYWENKEVILPVDLVTDSPIRARFSKEVLMRPVSAVRIYWQQMIFSGRATQPLEFPSQEEVIQYVKKNPNAIGYVSTDAAVSGTKKIPIK